METLCKPTMPGRGRAVSRVGHSTVYVGRTKPGKLILGLEATLQHSGSQVQQSIIKKVFIPHFRTLLPLITCSDLCIYTVPNISKEILISRMVVPESRGWGVRVVVGWWYMLWRSNQGMKLPRTHRPPQCEDTMRKEMSCMTNLPLSDTVWGHLDLPFSSL